MGATAAARAWALWVDGGGRWQLAPGAGSPPARRLEGAGRERDGGGTPRALGRPTAPGRLEREEELPPPIWKLGGGDGGFRVWRVLFGGLAGRKVILGLGAPNLGGRPKFS